MKNKVIKTISYILAGILTILFLILLTAYVMEPLMDTRLLFFMFVDGVALSVFLIMPGKLHVISEKAVKNAALVITGFMGFTFLAMLAACIILPILIFKILAAVSAVFFLILLVSIKKKKYNSAFNRSVVCLLIFIMCGTFWLKSFPMGFTVRTRFQYPVAAAYVRCLGRDNGYLPERLPDPAKDIRYEGGIFLSSERLSFIADAGYIETLRADAEGKAMHVFKYSEIDRYNVSLPDGKRIVVYPESFTDAHPDAAVYLLKTNYELGHPAYQAVLISGNAVCFTQV